MLSKSKSKLSEVKRLIESIRDKFDEYKTLKDTLVVKKEAKMVYTAEAERFALVRQDLETEYEALANLIELCKLASKKLLNQKKYEGLTGLENQANALRDKLARQQIITYSLPIDAKKLMEVKLKAPAASSPLAKSSEYTSTSIPSIPSSSGPSPSPDVNSENNQKDFLELNNQEDLKNIEMIVHYIKETTEKMGSIPGAPAVGISTALQSPGFIQDKRIKRALLKTFADPQIHENNKLNKTATYYGPIGRYVMEEVAKKIQSKEFKNVEMRNKWIFDFYTNLINYAIRYYQHRHLDQDKPIVPRNPAEIKPMVKLVESVIKNKKLDPSKWFINGALFAPPWVIKDAYITHDVHIEALNENKWLDEYEFNTDILKELKLQMDLQNFKKQYKHNLIKQYQKIYQEHTSDIINSKKTHKDIATHLAIVTEICSLVCYEREVADAEVNASIKALVDALQRCLISKDLSLTKKNKDLIESVVNIKRKIDPAKCTEEQERFRALVLRKVATGSFMFKEWDNLELQQEREKEHQKNIAEELAEEIAEEKEEKEAKKSSTHSSLLTKFSALARKPPTRGEQKEQLSRHRIKSTEVASLPRPVKDHVRAASSFEMKNSDAPGPITPLTPIASVLQRAPSFSTSKNEEDHGESLQASLPPVVIHVSSGDSPSKKTKGSPSKPPGSPSKTKESPPRQPPGSPSKTKESPPRQPPGSSPTRRSILTQLESIAASTSGDNNAFFKLPQPELPPPPAPLNLSDQNTSDDDSLHVYVC